MALTDAPEEPRKTPGAGLRKLLPFTTIGVFAAALYVGYIFYSRRQSEVAAQQAAAAKQHDAQQRVVDAVYGNGEILFSTFSSDRARLKRGEHTQLCYGVTNAKTVTLDPPVGETLKPAYRKCVEIAPTKTTEYKITATNAKGESKTEKLTVQVGQAGGQ